MNRSQLLNLLPKNSIGAELGVYLGDFSQEILSVVDPKRLYLIDVWEFIELNYHDKLMRNNKHQLNAYKTTIKKFYECPNVFMIRAKTEIIKDIFPESYFDWVYIDADHSYEGCMTDLINSDPLVKNDGLILGHDYTEKSFPGVVRAVEEFVKNKNYFLSFITNESDCPSFVITKNQKSHDSFINLINPNIL